MRTPLQVAKHWLFPHPANDHAPHILRTAATITLVIVAVLAESFVLARRAGVLPRFEFFSEIIDSVLVDQTNQNRATMDLGTLKENPILAAAAAAKAEDMASKGYFAHVSPSGLTPWYWFDVVGYKYAYAGENLAVNFTDSKDVTNAWMNSPGHRANILNSNFTEIGIASAHGTYQGHDAVFVVELFGRPALAAVTPAPTPVKPVAVRPAPVKVSPTSSEVLSANAAGASTTAPVEPAPASNSVPQNAAVSPIAKIVANPRRAVNDIAFVAILFVLAALAASLFEPNAPKRLIVNGFVVVLFLSGVIAVNQYLLNSLLVGHS